MSAEATGYVYRYSPYTGAVLHVHLAIADSVNDQNDNEFWLPMRRLGTKSRTDVSTASRGVIQMVADGFLKELIPPAQGRGKAGRYRFLFPERPPVYDSRNVVPHNIPPANNVASDQRNVGSAPLPADRPHSGFKATQENPRTARAPVREVKPSPPVGGNQPALTFGNPKTQPPMPGTQSGAVLPISTPQRRAALEAIPTAEPVRRPVAPTALAGIRALRSALRPDPSAEPKEQ